MPVSLDAFGALSYGIDANGNMIDITCGQSGTLPLTDNSFEWDQGSDANAVDAQPLTSVTVTIDVMPGSETPSGALTVRMIFADGGIYDARWNAPLDTEISGCPAG